MVVAEVDDRTVGSGTNVSYPNFLDWNWQQQSFEQLAAIQGGSVVLRGAGEAARLQGAFVSAGLFDLLRVQPALGRALLDSDDRVGAEPVAVIAHSLWQRRLGGAADFVGQAITLGDEPHTVIGVMPPGFRFPDRETEVWMSLGRTGDDEPMRIRRTHILTAVGRLAPGVTIEAAQADMDVIAARLQETYAGEDPGHGVRLTPMRDVIVEDARLALLVLLAGVGFVLLIACANVANLLLARAAGRRKEIAVRRAIGAGQGHVIRQLMIESLVLAAAGGALALLVAEPIRAALAGRLVDVVPRADEIAIDWRVLAFAAAVSIVTGLLFGLAPALEAARVDVNQSLKDDGGRSGHAAGSNRMRYGLVAAEIAISLVLLVGAGLMMKSFWRVLAVDPGFRPENVLTLTTSLPPSKYDAAQPIISFYGQLPERLEALPGIEAVSAVNALPVRGGDSYGEVTIEGRSFPPGEAPEASFRRILPSYFRTLGIRLLDGREFEARDVSDGPRVVIISARMARELFPDGDALGTRIKIGPSDSEPWLTIVGVVDDVRNVGLDSAPRLATYEVHAQRPWSTMNVVVRTAGDPISAISAVRAALLAAEPELLVTNITTMQQRISASVAPRRLLMALMATFAGLAVLLAAVGVYGVMSFVVTQRTREMGIRTALGASSGDLVRLVVSRAAGLTAAGLGVGLVAAVWASRLIESLLFEVSGTDPATLAVVSAALLGVALVASYLPARRAGRLDPMAALRGE